MCKMKCFQLSVMDSSLDMWAFVGQYLLSLTLSCTDDLKRLCHEANLESRHECYSGFQHHLKIAWGTQPPQQIEKFILKNHQQTIT